MFCIKICLLAGAGRSRAFMGGAGAEIFYLEPEPKKKCLEPELLEIIKQSKYRNVALHTLTRIRNRALYSGNPDYGYCSTIPKGWTNLHR